jgi:uncharacterized protein (DUF885 family)
MRKSEWKLSMNQIVIVLCLFLAGCASHPRSETANVNESDSDFPSLSEEFLAGYLAWRPQVGTSLGLHEFDGKVTDLDHPSWTAELARLKRFDSRLAKFNTSSLSSGASYDYRILQAGIKREIFRFEDMQSYTQNPMTYLAWSDVNIYIKRNFAPLETRVNSIIAIENQAPKIFSAARANLTESLSKPFLETAIEMANGAAEFLSKDLVEAVKKVKDETLMASFRTANAGAISELRNYVSYLKQEKLPKAHTHYALGREKYQRMLREGELISLSPESILAIGLKELQREQAAFAAAAKIIDPNRKAIEVFKEIQKEHPTAENLISDAKKNLEAIRKFVVDRRIVTIPSQVRVQVEETPQFARATSFASMDTPGPFETKATEAYYYVTPVENDWPPQQKEEWLTAFNYYTTDIVSIHEAYPGHYAQFLCLNASPATKLEKILDSYPFVEGWAHYTEQMMLEQGFGASTAESPTHADLIKAAKYRLAQSDEALLRLCRLCVSIKTHCEGMLIDEATRFFEENCYYEHKPAYQEALRGTFDPGYLYYTLGKLQILKLRRDYQEQEGAAFSLQRFHDEMLRHGMPPIRLLREIMLKDKRGWDEIF